MTSLKVSSTRRSRSRCPSSSGRSGRSSLPPSSSTRSASCCVFVVFATLLFAAGVALLLLRRPPAGARLPRRTTTPSSTTSSRSARATTLVRHADAARRAGSPSRCRSSSSGSSGSGPRAPTRLRRNRRIGFVVAARVRDPAADRRPGLAVFEVVPLLVLFELSIWLSVFMERRWHARLGRGAREAEARERSSPPTGWSRSRASPIRGRRGRDRDDGRIAAVGPRRARRGRALSTARDPARLRQRALAPRVRGLRRLRRRAPVRALDRPPHRAQGAARPATNARRSRELGAAECLRSGITTVGDCSFSGAAATACAELGLRAIVYLEVFGERRDAARSTASREHADADRGRALRRVRLGISPHAPYTCRRSSSTRPAAELGLPHATHLAESAAEREWLRDGTGAWAAARRAARPAARRDRDPRCSPRPACSARALGRALRPRRRRGDRAPRRARRRASPTARGRTRCSAAASRRSRELVGAGSGSGIGTDSPASTPSFDLFEELRTAIVAARARERRPRRADAPTTRSSSRRSAGRARSGSTARSARCRPGSGPTSPCVSLAGSPVRARWKIRLRQSSSAARPSEFSLLSSPARPATGEERTHGPMRQEPPEAPEAGCCVAPARPRAAPRRDRGHDVLPAAAPHAKWMFVFLALVFGLGFVGFGVGAGGVGVGDIFRGSGVTRAVRRSRTPRSGRRRTRRTPAAWRDLATASRRRARPPRRSRRSTGTSSSSRRTPTRSASSPASTSRTRASAAGRASSRSCESRISRPPSAVFHGTQPRRPAARRRIRSRTPSRRRCREARQRRALRQAQHAAAARGRRRTSGSWRSSRTTRTSSSSSRRRPSRAATRRRRSPRTGFLKLAPDDPSAPDRPRAAEAADAARAGERWLDSPPRERSSLDGPTTASSRAVVRSRRLGGGSCSRRCGDRSATPRARATGRGKELFVQGCGGCHALADAGTAGTIGPNLDYAFVQSRIDGLDDGHDPQVVRGQIAYPVVDPSTGAPGMPAGHIFRRAGRRGRRDLRRGRARPSKRHRRSTRNPPEPEPPGEPRPTASRSSPRRLRRLPHARRRRARTARSARTSTSRSRRALAIDRVTNGQGGMPSFKGQLERGADPGGRGVRSGRGGRRGA